MKGFLKVNVGTIFLLMNCCSFPVSLAKGFNSLSKNFAWKEIFMDCTEMNLEEMEMNLEGMEIHFAWKEIFMD